jgi:hypothetical protein
MEPNTAPNLIPDRVREQSPATSNKAIDRETEGRLLRYASKSREEITRRIEELEREWDMERLLETNASALTVGAMAAFAATRSRKWLFVPGVVMSFFLQHAVQGWCPPVPVFRRAGVRTRQEIERERYALKVLRGDFDGVGDNDGDAGARTEKALSAVRG